MLRRRHVDPNAVHGHLDEVFHPRVHSSLRSSTSLLFERAGRREVQEAVTIPIYGVEGFEADDVIGTLARIAEERGHAVTIVSGDLDCLQLVSESVEALVPRRGITDTFLYGPEQVRQRYGF